MPPVIDHLDETLARLASNASFLRKLEYASDIHSFENWLRTEIAFDLSKATYGYETSARASYWCRPEANGRVDLPVFRGNARNPTSLIELKILYNRQGRGNANRRALELDRTKLQRMRAPSKVLLATLVLMKYDQDHLWPARKRLRDMQHFMDDTFKDLPEARGKGLRHFDAEVKRSSDRPEFQVRLCRICL